MTMPSTQNSKVFGVDDTESKLPSNTAPLPPIADSQVSVDAEPTEKSPSVPTKLDNKSILPPISDEACSDSTGDDNPASAASVSTSHVTEPLPPISSDDKVVVPCSNEQSEVKKDDTTPLPPIETKDTNNTSNTEPTESVEEEEKSPLPPIVEETEADDTDAAATSNVTEVMEIKKAEASPLPPIVTDKKFGDVYFVLG